MRLDSFITRNIALPLLRLKRPCGPRLPILMYHSISEDPEPGRADYYKVCTAPNRFAEQMTWLASNGYVGVTLGVGLARLNEMASGTQMKSVAITFDDGFRDFYTDAFPVLKRHGFSATMFLPTSFIAEESQRFQSRDCLNWNDVGELNDAGIEFGSHTVTHPKLVETNWPEIEAELRDSKATIESRIGSDVSSFAYPYAFPQAKKEFVSRFQKTLQQTGYKFCVTTEVGCATRESNPFALQRLPMNDADDSALLEAKLAGAYDWLAIPQAYAKSARNLWRAGPRRCPGGQRHAFTFAGRQGGTPKSTI